MTDAWDIVHDLEDAAGALIHRLELVASEGRMTVPFPGDLLDAITLLEEALEARRQDSEGDVDMADVTWAPAVSSSMFEDVREIEALGYARRSDPVDKAGEPESNHGAIGEEGA